MWIMWSAHQTDMKRTQTYVMRMWSVCAAYVQCEWKHKWVVCQTYAKQMWNIAMFCDWAASCLCVAYADAYVCELMSLFRGKMRPYVQQIVQYDLIWHHMLKTFKRKYIYSRQEIARLCLHLRMCLRRICHGLRQEKMRRDFAPIGGLFFIVALT